MSIPRGDVLPEYPGDIDIQSAILVYGYSKSSRARELSRLALVSDEIASAPGKHERDYLFDCLDDIVHNRLNADGNHQHRLGVARRTELKRGLIYALKRSLIDAQTKDPRLFRWHRFCSSKSFQ